MGRKVANADVSIAKIAARQQGVVTVRQIYGLGLGERAVRVRVDSGRLHRLHRGVYAVGHTALSHKGHCMAAVLAVGRGPYEDRESVLGHWGAVVGHRTAAGLWGLLPEAGGVVDVVGPGGGGKARRKGIRVHRSLTLTPTGATLRGGIPVTTPARTVADLLLATSVRRDGAVSQRELRRAIRQANVIGLPIDGVGGGDRTRSDLEGDFLLLCRRGGLPVPEVNVRLGPYLVDFFWRERGLVVETDSYLYHGGRAAFQDDRSRDLELKSLGFEVLRLSERQVDEEPDRVVKALVAVLRSQS